jgi:hypothetical protein
MQLRIFKMIIKKTFTALSAILIFSSIFLFSCAGKQGMSWEYGYLIKNMSLKNTYHNKETLPDYNYYYYGTGLPKVVIGIDKKYKFNDRLWFKMENQADVYNKIKFLDDRLGARISNYVFFADIVSKDGEKIGIWFSYYTYTVIKIDPDKKSIIIFSPYSPNEGSGIIRNNF